MYKLLKKIHDNQTEMSFLFPAAPGPLVGIVEAVDQDRVTILIQEGSMRARIVTHPNSVILTEQIES